jgi:hypothetical protein
MKALGRSWKSALAFLFLLGCGYGLVAPGLLFAGHHSDIPPVCGIGARVDVAPSLPTLGESVQVVASGEWYDSCIPFYHSHDIDGNLIRVDAIVDYPPHTGCADVISPWDFAIDVGELPVGSYEVNLYITDVFNQVSVPTALCATRRFPLFLQLRRAYLPLIAK